MTPILLAGDTVKGFLPDATSCVVTEERNGIFELELTYPVAGPMFGELAVDRYIKAKPNDTAALQLFRIYEITKPISGIVTVRCEHVSYALAHYPVTNVSDTGTAAQAVGAVLAKVNTYLTLSHAFSAIDTGWTASKSYKFQIGSARAALGGTEGSLLDTFGGEYEWDNYTVKLHQNRGRDTGVIIAYRKNLTDLKVTTSLDSAYTALFPYAIKDDVLITVNGGKIAVTNTSGIADRVLIRDFSSEFQENDTVDATTLQTKANAYLSANSINAPSVNVTVSFVNLGQSPEYEELKDLESVSLCDWVTIRHEILGIDIKAQVIKTVYDSIAERYNSIELGSARANFQDTIQQNIKEMEKIARTIDVGTSAITQAYNQAIVQATALITSSPGGYVTMIAGANGKPTEIIVSDKEDYTDSTAHVWRWNSSGVGYSSTGYNGAFTTSIGSDNTMVTGSFTSGTINANLITAGILQSADGNSFFNLESGLIETNNVNITGGKIVIGDSGLKTEFRREGILLTGSMFYSTEYLLGGITPSVTIGSGNTYAVKLFYNNGAGSNTDGILLAAHDGLSRSTVDGVEVVSFGLETDLALFSEYGAEIYTELYAPEYYVQNYVNGSQVSKKFASLLSNGSVGLVCYQLTDVTYIEPSWWNSSTSSVGSRNYPFAGMFAQQFVALSSIKCEGLLQCDSLNIKNGSGYYSLKNYIRGVVNGTM